MSLSSRGPQTATVARSATDSPDLAEALEGADANVLGGHIRAARMARSLTQGAAADGIMSAAYLSRIESGQRRPDLRVLQQLAPRLDTTAHELLLGAGAKTLAAHRVELDWAQLSLRTGDPEAALPRIDSVLAVLVPGTRLQRRARYLRALALEATGDMDQATVILEDLTEDTTPSNAWESAIYTALCRCYRESGDIGRAIDTGRRGLDLLSRAGLCGGPEAIRLTLTLAAAHAEAGDITYASRLCQRALESADALRNPNERAACFWNASILESRRGHHSAAIELAQRALHVLDEDDSARNTARLRTQLGVLHLRQTPPDAATALRHLRSAEDEIRTSDASTADLADNLLGQARARFLQGNLSRAAREARACVDMVAGDVPLIEAEAWTLVGQVAFRNGDHDEASDCYGRAIAALTSVGDDRGAAQLWFDLAGLWLAVGCTEQALDAFQRSGASAGLQVNTQQPVAHAPMAASGR